MPRWRGRPGDAVVILTTLVFFGFVLFVKTRPPDPAETVSTIHGIVEGFHAGDSRNGHRVNTYHVRTAEGLAFVTDTHFHQIGAPLVMERVTHRSSFVFYRAAR